MNILLIGGGGREHALGWKLAQSPDCGRLYFAPGNGGTAALGENVPIPVTDMAALADFAEEKADFTVIGPELPLSLGLADLLRARGLAVFGPGRDAARLETSKAYAKGFMKKYNIPTAEYRAYDSLEETLSALPGLAYPLWAKADGLAAGKGAVFCPTESDARRTVEAMMRDRIFGDAGAQVVLEEHMEGRELTLLCLTDGETILPMDSARDYKRAYDRDEGPNTGGMGSISPVPGYAAGSADFIAQRTLAGIKAEGLDYRGVLYIGLMLTDKGPRVVEYNVRFGDPETEALLPRLENDLLSLLRATEQRRLHEVTLQWKRQTAVCVILASGGYPGAYRTGIPLTALPETTTEALIFHAGTAPGREGLPVTDGGRVLAVTALGADPARARAGAYALAKQVQFEGIYYRKDIAKEAAMRVITEGKTKTLYDLGNGQYQLYFKDDMTGENGVFDPGANTVGLTVEGAGLAGLRLSAYFFTLLAAKGVTATHFISADVENRTMTVKPATVFGKGLEIICRYTATGSFIRRYGAYVTDGAPLDAVVEMTLKDDGRGDPLINEAALVAIGVLEPGEYAVLSALTKEICAVIRDDLAEKGLKLLDIKLEFGREPDGKICLIDEISGGNMRVTEDGKAVLPWVLTERVVGR